MSQLYKFPRQSSGDSWKVISYCPLCQAQYNPKEAQILEQQENAQLIHMQCKKCDSAIVAVIMSTGFGLTSVGLVTDLNGDDVLKFKDSSEINTDDVIEIHQILNNQRQNIFY